MIRIPNSQAKSIAFLNRSLPLFRIERLALGYAGPDKGVNRTCFSLITLKAPVNFGVPENDPVTVVFSFTAPNKEEHMQALRDLAMFCSEGKNLELLRKATEKKQVREALTRFFSTK